MSLPKGLGSQLTTQESSVCGDSELVASQESPPSTKPIRLALACNQCRRRKVRCDAQQPRCRNCCTRGDVCETSDPRKSDHGPAVRRQATRHKRPKARRAVASNLPTSHDATQTNGPVSSINSVLNPTTLSPNSPVSISPGNKRAEESCATGPLVSPVYSWNAAQSERLGEDHFSWQSRAYQESAVAQGEKDHPTHRPAEGALVTPDEPDDSYDTTNRCQHLGASSVQSLLNFVDLHLARHGLRPIDPHFRHGIHTEAFSIPLQLALPMLPDLSRLNSYINAFFSRMWQVYPAIERNAFEDNLNNILVLQQARPSEWQKEVSLSDSTSLVSIYSIVSLGMNELSQSSESIFEFLTAGYSLHGHLAALPSLASVQALFLLALSLKSVAHELQAWHMVGQAIRMAQSIGLHAFATKQCPTQDTDRANYPETLHERLWWSCYAFENLMQLECGRPSIIGKSHDYPSFNYSARPGSNQEIPYFRAWINLTGIMGQISTHLYSHRIEGGSAELLGEVARLDQVLIEWESSLPDILKPRNNMINPCGDDHRVITTFLAQQYFHAQLSILRVAVIFPQQSLETEIRKHTKRILNHARLLHGASICADAARATVMQSLQLADGGLESTMLAIPVTYLAVVVLALCVLRQPTSRLARSDVELLASATEHVETWHLQRGFGFPFTQACIYLRDQVMRLFQLPNDDQNSPAIGSGSVSQAARKRHPRPDRTASSNIMPFSLAQGSRLTSLQGPDFLNIAGQGCDIFQDLEFQDLWDMTNLDFMVYNEN